MSAFKDPEAAVRTVERINSIALRSSGEFLLAAAETASRPDQALVNFERWLKASASPATLMDAVLGSPETGRLLVVLFGASHQIADVLVQNPELAHLVLDPSLLAVRPDAASLREEILSALSHSTGHTHTLDRLRFIKQGWHLRIAAADVAGLWKEEEVWLALSEVADALLTAAADAVWRDVCRQRGHQGECPVRVVAMGKLGGQELNFSSDIDLVYALDDAAEEQEEKLATRFGEALSRALSDRMGRGALYRVDLRLRPYGSRGPLVPRQASIEGYYGRYAEPWEHLALVRSRMVVGPNDASGRWERMRQQTCFQPSRGEWVVQNLLDMRARTEAATEDSDIKRGPGGIRDIEFLTQILQLLFGMAHPSVQVRPTCAVLRALQSSRIVSGQTAEDLVAAYTFLRQVEHRVQLLGDQQSHTVPEGDDDRADLAHRTGFASLSAFDSALAHHRSNARACYDAILKPQRSEQSDRDKAIAAAGKTGTAVARWLDPIAQDSDYYTSLLENESSLSRIVAVAERSPALIPHLRQNAAVTEQVMTGEVLEPFDAQLQVAVRTNDDDVFAAAIQRGWLKVAVRASLLGFDSFGQEMSGLMDAVLSALTEPLGTVIVPIALGSYGGREMGLFSDLDVLLYVPDEQSLQESEAAAQRLLARVQALRRAGAPIELDLRLRPEGKKGRLTVTAGSLRAYQAGSMEPWERLALGRARPLHGDLPAEVSQAAYGSPLDADAVRALHKMKHRVETERVPVQYRRRHIKLGPGGQDDLLWLTQLLWWKHIGPLSPHSTSVQSRIRALGEAGALTEASALESAWAFFARLRLQLAMLGLNDEVLPENPDRLAAVGALLGLGGANEVLARFEGYRTDVRRRFEETMERLES